MLFLRYSCPEHSQCQTKVLWSVLFCLLRSHCMEFFAICTHTSTWIWLLQVTINGPCVKFSPLVKNLGVTLDNTLLLFQHVMNVCRVAYLELRRINSMRNFLSVDAVKTLVCSLVLSRLDYCTPYLLVFLSILLRGFNEFKIQQPEQYLEHTDLSTSHHSSRTFTGYLSIWEPCCHTSLSRSGPKFCFDLTHV